MVSRGRQSSRSFPGPGRRPRAAQK